jgi:membrane associated rhomboid family serine protease
MIPFKDDNPTERFPFLTITFIAVNILVFFVQIFNPAHPGKIAQSYGAIPYFLLSFRDAQAIHPFLTIFSSMFMHGNLLHLGSNMLYLWIFGNNIEDTLGYGRFILFYFFCGAAATYSHALANPGSTTPMIGASGAVSGILGAYLLLFPRAKVHTLIFLGFFIQVVRLPAVFVIGFWIIIQFINGMLVKGIPSQGGVAWFAHIGGFVVGLLTVKIFLLRSKRAHYR